MSAPLPEPDLGGPPRPAGTLAWGETAVLALAPVLVGLWLRPGDPFFLGGGFSWPVLGPVLSGLRYGSLHGLACALLLDLSLLLFFREGHAGALPLATAAGFALCGALCGEFCDGWTRRMGAASLRAEQARARLGEFSRTFQVLRASHEKLERRALGATSLREALLAVRRAVVLDPGADGLGKVSERILALLAEHAAVHAASLHPIDRQGRLLPAVATLGDVPVAPPDDPLVREALAQGKLAALPGPGAGPSSGPILAALPLTDIAGTVHALVVVRDLHFLAFNDDTLALLAVIGGHLGDIVAAAGGGPDDPTPAAFERKLRRAAEDARRFGLPSTLITLALRPLGADALAGRLLEERRGLDPAVRLRDAEGRPLVLILLQLTDAGGAGGYLSRLDRLLGRSLSEGATASVRVISGTGSLDDLLAPLQPTPTSDAPPAAALPARC
jgi:hypothetical protein